MYSLKTSIIKIMKLNKNIDVESQLLGDLMDLNTLEDVPEKDEYEPAAKDSAAELVKQSYAELKSCHAIISEKIALVVVLGLAFMMLGALVVIGLYGIIYSGREGAFIAWIMGGIILIMAGSVLIFLSKRYTNIFDIYLFKLSGKNIVFYINKKYTIYYRNRTELICIKNSDRTEKNYSYDSFMNTKLGYSKMLGQMKVKETAVGYKIRTTQLKRSSSAHFGGNSTLWLDKSVSPVKMLIGNRDVYKFVSVNDPNMQIVLPRELLDICNQRGMVPPPQDSRIVYN